MAKIIDISVKGVKESLCAAERFFMYNAYDSLLTYEILHEIEPHLRSNPTRLADGSVRSFEAETYEFSRAMQAPVADMMRKGLLVDDFTRGKMLSGLSAERVKLEARLKRWLFEALELSADEHPFLREFNHRSNAPGGHLQQLFYGVFGLPPIIAHNGKPTTDRDALERLARYPIAQPICNMILALRDIEKVIGTLRTEIDTDGHIRTTLSIAGTNTGRMASYTASNGKGTNLQNLDPALRHIFCARPGKKQFYIDLEQAESRLVGAIEFVLFGDASYLDACESDDLHTSVARMVWPHINSREQADETYVRNFSYRFMCKRIGHGCLTPDHEVLTRIGWVPITDKPAEIMCWSPSASSFMPTLNWFDFQYDGKFVSVEGRSASLMMTGNHKVIYKTDDTDSYQIAAADSLPKSAKIPLGFGYRGGSSGPSPELARIIAAFQCDGNRQSSKTIRFHMKKERKFTRLAFLCDEADIEFVRKGNRASVKVMQDLPKFAGAYLLDWSEEAVTAYVDEHKFWDGHISGTAVSLFSKTRKHLEWLQTMGRLIGIGGNFQKVYHSGFGTPIHRLQQNHREFLSYKSATVEHIDMESRVLCPTVPTGAFYVRRNGKISVTGNSNYVGTPRTIAQETSVPIANVTDFQDKYFAAFPAHRLWHHWVAQQLATQGFLVSLMGRKRWFMGRHDDDATLREAVAFDPQSSIADLLNRGLFRLWWRQVTQPAAYPIDVLLQVHDAALGEYPEDADETALLPRLLDAIETPITLKHKDQTRILQIPSEVKVGFNWGDYSEGNPDGLKKWAPTKPDTRIRQNNPWAPVLDTKISG